MFGWIRVRLKELMPLLYRHWQVFCPTLLSVVLKYMIFCSWHTTASKIWRANFTEHQCVILFISVDEWKEGHTNSTPL